jgi:hypothetical protein
MRSRTVVGLDKDEQRQLTRLLPNLWIALPEREIEDGPDWLAARLLKRLVQPDYEWDDATSAELLRTLDLLAVELERRGDPSFWQGEPGVPIQVPGNAASPDEVLAETARAGLRDLAELRDVVEQLHDLTLGLPARAYA